MSDLEHLFMCLLAICMSSLVKWLFRSFAHFWLGCLFFWYWVVWAACIFWKLILVSCFICYHFLPFWGLSFHSTHSFLCCVKAFKFNQVPLVYCCFYFCNSRRCVIRVLLWFMSLSILPMFSSKSFRVSGLTFRSLIQFEFIFVYCVRKCSNLILSHVAVQFCKHHLLKRLSLPPLYILASFVKNEVPIGAWVYFWAFYLVPLVYISVFVPVPYCLDDCKFVI